MLKVWTVLVSLLFDPSGTAKELPTAQDLKMNDCLLYVRRAGTLLCIGLLLALACALALPSYELVTGQGS